LNELSKYIDSDTKQLHSHSKGSHKAGSTDNVRLLKNEAMTKNLTKPAVGVTR
jgi:hypothetical protein